jgi:hypothetical protein
MTARELDGFGKAAEAASSFEKITAALQGFQAQSKALYLGIPVARFLAACACLALTGDTFDVYSKDAKSLAKIP